MDSQECCAANIWAVAANRLQEQNEHLFRQWFQKLNAECLEEKERLFEDIYMQKSAEELGMICFPAGKYAGHSIAEVCRIDPGYLKYHQTTNFPYAKAVGAYLKKMQL